MTSHIQPDKISYYKVVCEEYPKGVFFESKGDALEYSNECRLSDCKSYTRMVKVTKEEVESYPEL